MMITIFNTYILSRFLLRKRFIVYVYVIDIRLILTIYQLINKYKHCKTKRFFLNIKLTITCSYKRYGTY